MARRAELAAAGHDAGPATIGHHLGRQFAAAPSLVTVWRILRSHDLIVPQPHRRPRSSFVRFEAALPNELWLADTTGSQGSGVTLDRYSHALPTLHAEAMGRLGAVLGRSPLDAPQPAPNEPLQTQLWLDEDPAAWGTPPTDGDIRDQIGDQRGSAANRKARSESRSGQEERIWYRIPDA